jgi:hypothetical protein
MLFHSTLLSQLLFNLALPNELPVMHYSYLVNNFIYERQVSVHTLRQFIELSSEGTVRTLLQRILLREPLYHRFPFVNCTTSVEKQAQLDYITSNSAYKTPAMDLSMKQASMAYIQNNVIYREILFNRLPISCYKTLTMKQDLVEYILNNSIENGHRKIKGKLILD